MEVTVVAKAGETTTATTPVSVDETPLEVTPTTIEVTVGEQATITPNKDGVHYELVSDGDSIAAVSPDGTVTGIKPGTTSVIVSDDAGNSVKVDITVKAVTTTTGATSATTTTTTTSVVSTASTTEKATTDVTTAATKATTKTTTTSKTTISATAATQYFFSAETDWSRFSVVDSSKKAVTGVEFRYEGKAVASPKAVFVEGVHKYDLDMYKDGSKIGTATAYIGVKGDCSLDDKVNSIDAVDILQAFANTIAKKDYSFNSDANLNTLAMFLADIDTETADISKLNSIDAVYILKYFAQDIAKLNPTWSNLVPDLKGKNY
jgi:hypothetical protein